MNVIKNEAQKGRNKEIVPIAYEVYYAHNGTVRCVAFHPGDSTVICNRPLF